MDCLKTFHYTAFSNILLTVVINKTTSQSLSDLYLIAMCVFLIGVSQRNWSASGRYLDGAIDVHNATRLALQTNL